MHLSTHSQPKVRRGRATAMAAATAVVAALVLTGAPAVSAVSAATTDPNPGTLELK